MKIISNVKSKTKPIKIDDTSSNTTVFVRYNIRKSVEIDPIFKTEDTVYTYDEKQYSIDEWRKIIYNSINKNNTLTQEQVDITQLALVEILSLIELLYTPMTMSLDNEEDTDFMSSYGFPIIHDKKNKYSAISIMYGNMIKRKLLEIDKVPSMFTDEVNKYLQEKE